MHASLVVPWISVALFIMLPWIICQHRQTCDFCRLLEGSALRIYSLLTTFAVFPSKCCCQDPVLIMWCSQISIFLPFPSTGSIIKVLYSYHWHSPIVEVTGGSHGPHGSLKWLLVPLIFFTCHQDRCRMSLINLRGSEKGRNELIFFLAKGIHYQQDVSDRFRRERGKERGEKCWTVGNCLLRTGKKEVGTNSVKAPHAWNSHRSDRAAFEFAASFTTDRVGKQQPGPAAPVDSNEPWEVGEVTAAVFLGVGVDCRFSSLAGWHGDDDVHAQLL